MATVFAIIPVFNRVNYTKECLDSFTKQTHKDFKVILVDSGSTDGTVNFVKKSYPFVKIIRGNSDWWWTKAMFEGIRWATKNCKTGDFVLEMNNDCHFDKNYLKQLLKTNKKHPSAIIGSLCVKASYPKFVVESGVRIDWTTGCVYGVAWTESNEFSYYQKMKLVTNLDALPGKGTLIPIEVFRKIGSVNVQRLPHYIADYEFTNRAKRAGWELIVDTKAIIKHHWEATGNSSSDRRERNTIRRAVDLLFGRKSMNNIVDWINFLNLACPRELLLRNYYITSWKLIYAIFSIYPLTYLRPILGFLLRSMSHTYHSSRLIIYRAGLYISQFDEYHLISGKKYVRHSRKNR